MGPRNLANSPKLPESPESPESCELTKSLRVPTEFQPYLTQLTAPSGARAPAEEAPRALPRVQGPAAHRTPKLL
eukprot:1706319-Prymnesium_polylepis.1